MSNVRWFGVVAAIVIVVMVGGPGPAVGGAGNPSTAVLSEAEVHDLQHVRDEEKLARDVYLYLAEIYRNSIFINIAESEQKHMDAVKTLLDRYGIDDPVEGLEEGEFAYYGDLYDILTTEGSPADGEALIVALEGALHVGATIEDLDICDIQQMLANTNRPDLMNVYENLMKGSRNHLRAFVGLLTDLYYEEDEFYEAQYLSQQEVDEILSTDKETGR